MTTEVALLPTISARVAIRPREFTKTVRERDWRCILSGRPARIARYGDWTTFEATRIFPLAYEGQWNDLGYGNLLTAPPTRSNERSINSPQNGILFDTTEHHIFASYDASIDPDVSISLF